VLVPNFVHLVVDHVIKVVVIGNCDNPIITCISLGKSTSTTFNASTFGMFHASNSMLVGVEVFNVHVIATSLKTLKEKKNPNVIFIEFSKIIRQPSFHGLNLWLILMVRCNKCIARFI